MKNDRRTFLNFALAGGLLAFIWPKKAHADAIPLYPKFNPKNKMGAFLPSMFERDTRWVLATPYATAANRYKILTPNYMSIDVGGYLFYIQTQQTLDLSAAAAWDTQTPTDYTVAANRAGKQFYIYACQSSGDTPTLLVSDASTYPSGYTAANSRKVGGFHCLCVNVGTISGHTLTGFLAGDVLPASVWDLKHKPKFADPSGMVFSDEASIWVDIYLASGTGSSTVSAYGGTISDDRNWMDFVDDGGYIKKRLLWDSEFQKIAAGSNEQTNIAGSADPVTTGGHVDTAARRMISNIGCEDCAGAMYQWLMDQSYRYDPNGTVNAAGLTFTVTHAASPGGNAVYLKQASSGIYYLACNMAVAGGDKYIGPTNFKIPIKHEADPATGSIAQVYYYNAGSHPARLIANISTIGKDVFIPSNNGDYTLQIAHNANAATTGVALNYDDTDSRLEAVVPGAADGALDLACGTSFSSITTAGSNGKFFGQGAYGDVKLFAGFYWGYGSNCGSRGRNARSYRWYATSYIGARFAAEPL